MKKRLMGIALVLGALFALMPATAFAEMGTVPTEVWVNGADIMQDADSTLECGGGTAVYEASSNTLTLNAAEIGTADQAEAAGIFANGDLNIVVNGDCTVSDNASIAVGVSAAGSLSISGEGRLAINVEAIGIKAADLSLADASVSVTCRDNSLWTYQGALTVSSGSVTAASTGDYPAIWANSDLVVTGGTIDVVSSGSNGMGTDGSLSISGTADVTATGPYPGLYAFGGISISGGKVNSTGTDDSGIFTRGALSISGEADVVATGGKYCGIQANGAITISSGKVQAVSSKDSAIYSPVSITVTGSPNIAAEGYLRALQTADLDVSGGTVNARSAVDSAILATAHFSITGDAEVIADGKICGLLAVENMMTLSAKSIEAHSADNYAVCNMAGDIAIDGVLTAKSETVYGIRAFGNIVADNKAVISAEGGWGGIWADDDITFNGSSVEALGHDDDGIYSTGTISINGSSVHAKGAPRYLAIRTKSIQAADEAATSKIVLSNVVEQSGGKVANTDYFDYDGETRSWTAFIGKDDTELANGMGNALNEVRLAVPCTVTFDVNGGEGDVPAERVYPGDKVAKPADPVRSGWIFTGWQYGDSVFDFANTPITEDIVLTAQWHAHAYGTDWKSDATNHWHECSCGIGEDVAAHSYGEWVTTKAATATEQGSKERTCSVCGYKEVADIPVLGKTELPQAGDGNTVFPLMVLLLISGAALTGAVVRGKRKRRFE